jgi:hypothetical protein
MDIPYRLDSVEAILAAERENFLSLGNGYNRMLRAARRVHVHYPEAFRLAKKSVKKDFTIINEEKISKINVLYEEIADLDLAGNQDRIAAKIPWLNDMICHTSTFQYIETFPTDVRKAMGCEHAPATPSDMLEAHIALRRLIKREILHYAKTGRAKSLDLNDLKRLVTAMTLFDSPQQDILHLLKQGEATDAYLTPYQNILAEMLFARLPQTMGNLVMANPLALRQKLLARIARMEITGRQRMTLYGYCQQVLRPQQLMDAMGKMKQVSMRMSLAPETKRSLHDYLDSLKSLVEKISDVYKIWFLDRELEIIRKFHEPGHWLKSRFTYSEDLVQTYAGVVTMEFYPTKDYLDICKGDISGDCVDGALGEAHLRYPRYFSIRIFMGRQWVGNIYILDFTDTHGILLVDRIQIPRDRTLFCPRFFDRLREAFEELFADLAYQSIILPLSISNHDAIQKAFNTFRKRLSPVEPDFKGMRTKIFESLNELQQHYVQLCGKRADAKD